jgi:hypothetical protein
MDEI